MKCIVDLLNIFDNPSANLPKWVQGCYSKYPFESMREIRKLLQNKQDPPIQQVIDSGVVPQIMKLLTENNHNFEMLLHGFVREINFEYLFPYDIINEIDNISRMYAIDDKLQEVGRCVLINLASGNELHANSI